MNKIHKKHFFVYLLMGLIGVALALIIFPFLPISFSKFHLCNLENISTVEGKDDIYSHDLTKDNKSEIIRLKLIETNTYTEFAVNIMEADGSIIGTFNLEEPWMKSGVIFGDYDKNGQDEVYVISQLVDSLFVYAYDISKKSLFLNRVPLLQAETKKYYPEWDVRFKPGFIEDINGDGFGEIIFGIVGGWSKLPRQLYAFNIITKRIEKKSGNIGAYFSRLNFFDFENNGAEEILLFSRALHNTIDIPISFKDNSAYVLIYDKNFQLTSWKEFTGDRPFLKAFPCKINGKPFLFSSVFYNGEDEEFGSIYLLNDQLNIVDSLQVINSRYLTNFSVPSKNSDRLYYFNSGEILHMLNENLEIVKKFSFKEQLGEDVLVLSAPQVFDMNHDGLYEILFAYKENITLLDENLENFDRFFLSDKEDIKKIFQIKTSPFNSKLGIQTDKSFYTLSYEPNILYYFQIPFFIFLFCIIQIVLYYVLKVYRWRLFIVNYDFLALKKSNRPFMKLDMSGRIDYVSLAFEQLTGSDAKQIKYKSYQEIFESPITSFVKKLIKEEKSISEDIEYNFPQKKVNCLIIGKPIIGLFKITFGYFIEMHDYSKTLKEDRIKIWNKTIQQMVHDIRAPLSSISLNLSALKHKIKEDKKQDANQDIDKIQADLNQIKSQTKNFMKFVNLVKPDLQLVSFQEILTKAIFKFQNYINEDITIETEIEPEHLKIWTDPNQIIMAFQILIENAMDAIKGKGKIKIVAHFFNQNKSTENVKILISDTGEGIPSALKNYIFEPNVTTKTEGTGMGLTIAKKIIEDQGGEIDLVDLSNYSTTFQIFLYQGSEVRKDER